jgi:hypothetical protein
LLCVDLVVKGNLKKGALDFFTPKKRRLSDEDSDVARPRKRSVLVRCVASLHDKKG